MSVWIDEVGQIQPIYILYIYISFFVVVFFVFRKIEGYLNNQFYFLNVCFSNVKVFAVWLLTDRIVVSKHHFLLSSFHNFFVWRSGEFWMSNNVNHTIKDWV